MTFNLIPPSGEQATIDRCNRLMTAANALLLNTITVFKGQWSAFWDSSLTQAEMQAQLDLLAITPTQGGQSNALQDYFDKGLRLIAYAQTEEPNAFADSRTDESGQCHEYLGPGWTYTTEQSGRIVVVAPCVWVNPAEQPLNP